MCLLQQASTQLAAGASSSRRALPPHRMLRPPQQPFVMPITPEVTQPLAGTIPTDSAQVRGQGPTSAIKQTGRASSGERNAGQRAGVARGGGGKVGGLGPTLWRPRPGSSDPASLRVSSALPTGYLSPWEGLCGPGLGLPPGSGLVPHGRISRLLGG